MLYYEVYSLLLKTLEIPRENLFDSTNPAIQKLKTKPKEATRLAIFFTPKLSEKSNLESIILI